MNINSGYCNGFFKVNMNEVTRNFNRVKEYIGPNTEIIPVVKGNCYGYGIVPMAKHFNEKCGASVIACSAIFEGVKLRDNGLTCDILIIGGIPRHLISTAIDYNFQFAIFDCDTAELVDKEARRQGKQAKVHIKLETGMNRLGIKPGLKLGELLAFMRTLDNIDVIGAYTHFATSTADYYDDFAVQQFNCFKKGIEQIEKSGIALKYIHCCNSAAIAWFKEAYGTHVRSCSSILGHEAMEDGREPIGLVEPVTIGSFITNIHEVLPGESIGYSRAYIVEKPMTIATVSIGFADGLCKSWLRGAPVIVSGVKTRFLGCCMDQSFVDVTGIECSVGQNITLIGQEGGSRITTRDIEVFTGETFEFLFGTIGERIARIYE